MASALKGSGTKQAEGESPFFPPEVALHLVKIACEMPDRLGRALSLWDCRELAHKLEEDGIVKSISAETVRRILNKHHLKPWRHHMWLGAKTPRDEAFHAQVKAICDLYTRELLPHEMVLCLDEKTSLQPRTRKQPTKPAKPKKPVHVEHEYLRKGALNLFAAFDTRTGRVYGRCFRRKRQIELIAFLDYLNGVIPERITRIHVVCDNLRVHKGKEVMRWLRKHQRFSFHFTPVHCSWMNQVEQWFSILQRKRFKIADFASIEDLRDKIYRYIDHWNHKAHPFKWATKSVAKIMAYAEPLKEAA
jgi:transposase